MDKNIKAFEITNYSLARITEDFYNKNKEKLFNIADYLHKVLDDSDSIDFNTWSDGKIYICVGSKFCTGYYIATEPIESDFNGIENVLELIIHNFKSINAKGFNEFIKEGEKHGWD